MEEAPCFCEIDQVVENPGRYTQFSRFGDLTREIIFDLLLVSTKITLLQGKLPQQQRFPLQGTQRLMGSHAVFGMAIHHVSIKVLW